MGAFIDAQLILSNLPGNISFVKSKDIIKSYIARLQENSEVSDSEKDYLIDSMKEITQAYFPVFTASAMHLMGAVVPHD